MSGAAPEGAGMPLEPAVRARLRDSLEWRVRRRQDLGSSAGRWGKGCWRGLTGSRGTALLHSAARVSSTNDIAGPLRWLQATRTLLSRRSGAAPSRLRLLQRGPSPATLTEGGPAGSLPGWGRSQRPRLPGLGGMGRVRAQAEHRQPRRAPAPAHTCVQ